MAARDPRAEKPFSRVDEARAVLDANWSGRHTIPAEGLYPHQWNWDSGFIAIGRSRFDQRRAEAELTSLFGAQWRTGMLPHIVFNPKVPERDYFPGPEFWRSEKAAAAPSTVRTSGLTQPPIHAVAALEIHRNATDEAAARRFLERLHPRLVALHRYLRDRRATEDLAYIVHPWESGLDNSPAWHEACERVEIPEGALPEYRRRDLELADPRDRPSQHAYDVFVYLAVLARKARYDDDRVRETAPFLVEDPLFNTIWAWSAVALAEISTILGRDGAEFREDAGRVVGALESKLWSEKDERFFPFDLRDGRRMDHHSIVSFAPLAAPGIDGRKAQLLVRGIREVCGEGRCLPVPSTDLRDREFDPRRYWRGPVWINTDWLLYRGCVATGERRMAEEIRGTVADLIGRSGFREYFDPRTGEGRGADRFSWSAALYLDLAAG